MDLDGSPLVKFKNNKNVYNYFTSIWFKGEFSMLLILGIVFKFWKWAHYSQFNLVKNHANPNGSRCILRFW